VRIQPQSTSSSSKGPINYPAVPVVAQVYAQLLLIACSLLPSFVIAYLYIFQNQSLLFENHRFHEFAIGSSVLAGGFVSYITWRCYYSSGESLLRWLTLGFIGFTLIYLPHGVLTFYSHHNMALFLIYGPVSRLVMAGFVLMGLSQFNKPNDPLERRNQKKYWWPWIVVFLIMDLVVALLANSSLDFFYVRQSMELGSLCLLIIAIVIILAKHARSSLMKIYAISLAFFAQSSVAFLLGSVWNHMWWLAHGIFAGGFFLLTYGIIQAFFTTRSFSNVYSIIEMLAVLRESEERFRLMVEGVQDFAMVMLDPKGKIISWNLGTQRIYGYSTEEIVGKDFSCFYLPSDVADGKPTQALEVASKLQYFEDEGWRCRKDGSTYFSEEVVSALHDDHGVMRGFAILSRDITQRKKSEEQLMRSSKMAALGEMASGLAHEINNPLAIILGKVNMLERSITSPPLENKISVLTEIQKIKNTTHRIATIVRGLRTFSRDGENDPFEKASIKAIVNDTLGLCQERFKHNDIDLQIQDFPDAALDCRSTQISQVILNILNNAFDAIETLPKKWIRLEVTKLENARLQITVTDSGSGIPDTIADRLMQPFFTTKEIGKGTGLGLSISHAIAKEHGGSLTLDRHSFHTRFVLELPLQQTNEIE